MHVLDTNFAAISGVHSSDNFSESPLALLLAEDAAPLRQADVEFAVHIIFSETVVSRVEQLEHFVAGLLELRRDFVLINAGKVERINISLVVTVSHVGTDESEDLEAVLLGLDHVTLRGRGDVTVGQASHGGARAELEACEVRLPLRVDRLGILLPVLVQRVSVDSGLAIEVSRKRLGLHERRNSIELHQARQRLLKHRLGELRDGGTPLDNVS